MQAPRAKVPGQVVLVLQGGGALGAYQAGVYEALHEWGVEPNWVIGTSIGAINGALICGNPPERRLDRLREFWSRIEQRGGEGVARLFGLSNLPANVATITQGVPAFFVPNPLAWLGTHVPLGVESAAYYSTSPLRATLTELVDLAFLDTCVTRLTVGAVDVANGEMCYFDSRDQPVRLDHVLASGALPPAFPAVEIDGELYWDGGIYSNTPIEVVFDDNPRRDALIFSVNMWQPQGTDPNTLWQVMGRQKDIQYSSRGLTHVARQQQLHRLRHVIRELTKHLPADVATNSVVRDLASYGCSTTMHLVRLLAPRLDNEDHTKDIDFTASGIRARWQAGHDTVTQVIAAKPWADPIDALTGVSIHEAILKQAAG